MIYKFSLWLFCILLPVAGAVTAQDETFQATLYQTVNVRSGPDTRYEIVGQVTAGDTVSVTGRGAGDSLWVQVELTGADVTVGWVPSYLLIFEGELSDVPVVGADSPDTSEDSEGGTMVMVTAYGTVNVRSGPSIIEDIIAQLDVGDEARALARSNERNDWLYVENTSLTGWVAYFTVDVDGDPRTLPLRVPDIATDDLVHPRELVATLFNVQLRAEPSAEAEEVGVLDFDTEVTAFARADDPSWIYVGTEALRGWGATELFDITLEHLEALPTYSEDAVYELLPTEDDNAEQADAPASDPVSEAEPTAVVTPFLFDTEAPPATPEAEATEAPGN